MGNLAMYATKGFEYLLILGFLALFTIFYLYFTSGRFEATTAVISRSFDSLVDWFRVPDNIFFHQGHTWAKREDAESNLVLVGIDDFAQKLAGPMGIRNNPTIGNYIWQGERSWSLQDGEKSVDMLAPVSGEVIEVNIALLKELENNSNKIAGMVSDPYEHGWILKVKANNFERERKGLLSGTLAKKWMEETVEHLRSKINPELGVIMQDGGMPVVGMAKNINAEEWDQILKGFFLT
jgi:glycine cleavage system H protein